MWRGVCGCQELRSRLLRLELFDIYIYIFIGLWMYVYFLCIFSTMTTMMS